MPKLPVDPETVESILDCVDGYKSSDNGIRVILCAAAKLMLLANNEGIASREDILKVWRDYCSVSLVDASLILRAEAENSPN